MTERLEFEIPGKPVVQKRPIVLRRGWTIDPNSKDKKRIGLLATVARQNAGNGLFRPDYKGKVGLRLSFFGCRSNADISNYVKLIEDSCNKILWYDDCQITALSAFKVPCDSGEEGTTVEVYVPDL